MRQQERDGKIYLFLLALTVVFLGVLAFCAHENRRLRQADTYTVQTQYETTEETAPKRELVPINTASEEELEKLTGIGPALAKEIISYRNEHGAFSCAEELLGVKGIGEAKLEDFREEITFQ